MQIGLGLPRLPDSDGIRQFTQRAEQLGFESVLVGDHIVLPTAGTNQYPYTADGSFSRPSDEPFFETMTTLGFMAACSDTIKLGSTVIILPYRNPVVQAKMFASLDVLTNGRMICGVGVGWLEKEFETLGLGYADRGPMTDEFLQIFRALWTEDNPEFHGKFYDIYEIQFAPKPVQKPGVPIWVGGHTNRALRRRWTRWAGATRSSPSPARSRPVPGTTSPASTGWAGCSGPSSGAGSSGRSTNRPTTASGPSSERRASLSASTPI